MEIIYEAYNFFKTNGFVHLPHIIAMNHDIDIEDLYYFYEKEKDNKEIINFMNHYQNEYGLKTTTEKIRGVTYKIGTISNGECIICYEENNAGLRTPCNHFMCMECCVKLFENDNNVKKCPYCREDVIIYRMNEVIQNIKNNIEDDLQDQFIPVYSSSEFLRGRLVEDDIDEISIPNPEYLAWINNNTNRSNGEDELNLYLNVNMLYPESDLLTFTNYSTNDLMFSLDSPIQRPSLIQHYLARFRADSN